MTQHFFYTGQILLQENDTISVFSAYSQFRHFQCRYTPNFESLKEKVKGQVSAGSLLERHSCRHEQPASAGVPFLHDSSYTDEIK